MTTKKSKTGSSKTGSRKKASKESIKKTKPKKNRPPPGTPPDTILKRYPGDPPTPNKNPYAASAVLYTKPVETEFS